LVAAGVTPSVLSSMTRDRVDEVGGDVGGVSAT